MIAIQPKAATSNHLWSFSEFKLPNSNQFPHMHLSVTANPITLVATEHQLTSVITKGQTQVISTTYNFKEIKEEDTIMLKVEIQ